MRITSQQGVITTGGGGGAGPQAMWPGYQDTQSLAFTWWCPTTQTSFSDGVYTGSISSNVLTVTAVTSGIVLQGQVLSGTGIPAGVSITGFRSGTFYGVGTYNVSPCPNVASTTITGNAGDPDYYHVYESTGGAFTLSPGQSGTNPVLTNPGVTASNGLAPNTHNPVLGYVRNALAPGTTMQFAVKPVTAGIEGVFGPTLTMSTLVNGPSAIPVPPANTSWEVALQIPAITAVVCNTQADFQNALTTANINGPNLIVLTAGNTFAIPNTNGYQLPAFTGTGGFTYIISSEAPEFKTGGKLIPFNANAGSPVWQVFTCTAVIPANATSATLTAAWAQKSGWYYVWFQEGSGTAAVIEERWVVFTQGSATIDWHLNNGNYPNPGLSAQATTTLRVFYEPSVTPWDAFTNNAMPTIDLGATVNAFGIQVPGACTNVRFIGINLKTTGVGAAASTTQATGYIHFANSPEPSQGPPATPAESIYFDRCMWGNDTGSATYQFCAHGLGWVNCNHLLVSQCYGYGVATNYIPSGGDSNNFGFNGKNHLWRSTYLSAVSECHIIGGGFMDNVNPPSDMHFLNCSTHKPLGWLQGVSVAIASYTPGPGSVGATGGMLAQPWGFASGTCNVALSAENNTATFTNGSTTFTFGTALTKTDTLLMNPQGFAAFSGAGGLVPYWQFGREVKNHLELKNGARTTYTGIVSRNNWVGKVPGYHGTVFGINCRDQQMSANAAINYTDCCPYVATLDVDIQNCITLNCPSALVVFTSDFQISAYTARVRYKNNLSWISTYSVGEQMAAIWLIGPVSDVIIDQCTFITNQQVSTVGFGGALGVHFSWFNPLQGSNANMTPFSPFPFTPYQDRLTITNCIMDSSVSGQPPNPAFFQDTVVPINFSTFPNITFNKNVTINDTSPGYPNMAGSNIPYANIGFQNYQVNNLPPLNLSDWNVVDTTKPYATASTTGGPIGATFGNLAITTASLPNAVVGTNYNTIATTLQASGGSGNYAWNVENATLNRQLWFGITQAGAPFGIPQCDSIGQGSDDSITLRVTDLNNPGIFATATFPLHITVSGTLSIVSPLTLPTAAVGSAATYQLFAAGGGPPYIFWKITAHTGSNTWCITNNGWLSCVGGAVATAGDTVTVQVGDAAGGTASATFTIAVTSGIQLPRLDYTNNLYRMPLARVGHKYKHTIQPAYGGTGSGQVFSIVNGALPAGLTLTGNVVSGTPTASGAANCSLQCVDSGPNTTPAVPIYLQVASTSIGTRPAANTASGFFVDTTGQFCDPGGHRFPFVGINRSNFGPGGTAWPTSGANMCRFTLFTSPFRGAGNGTAFSTYVADIVSAHTSIGQYVVAANFYKPGAVGGAGNNLTGGSTLTDIGLVAAFWCDNVASWNGSLQNKAGINPQNEWGPQGSVNFQSVYAAAWDGPVGVGTTWQMPIASVNNSTGVITLTSTAAAHPLTNASLAGWIFVSGGNVNKAVQISGTGGSSGAWTITPTTASDTTGYTSGGTVSGGVVGMLRAAGYTDPLHIDAGAAFGQRIDNFTSYGPAIAQSDPLQNVVLAYHAYNDTVNYAARVASVSIGANAAIRYNDTAAAHPMSPTGLFANISHIRVTGVGGVTSINGTIGCTGNALGGAAPNWTTTSTVTTTGAYTGGGLVVPGVTTGVFGYQHVDALVSQMVALQASGTGVSIEEFGPSAVIGPSPVTMTIGEVIQAAVAAQQPLTYWAMDDATGLGISNGNPVQYTFGATSAGNNTYSVPANLSAAGVDLILNPNYGVHALAAPAPVFLP